MAVSGVQVRTSVHVAARSYTYVANEICRIFLEAITRAGLDPTAFAELQATIENGLRTWLSLRHLETAYLEIVDSRTKQVRSRIDLALTYSGSGGDEAYRTDIDRVRAALGNTQNMQGCEYRVVVDVADGAPAVRGWSATVLGSVDHLTRKDIGKVIDAPAAGAVMFRWGS